MRTTVALYWKSLLRVIHPPLPLSPRGSQRLLYLLKKTARKQLDSRRQPPVGTHIQNVLESPMFMDRVRPAAAKRAPKPLNDEELKADPVGYLRQAIAGGYAKEETIRRCLSAQLRKSKLSTHECRSIQESGAGSLVAQWLWSSGMQRSLQFLPDHNLTSLLVQVLVADGRHEIIYAWLAASETTLRGLKTVQHPAWVQSRIMLDLMRAETTLGGGPESALKIFLDHLEGAKHARRKASRRRNTFGVSGHYLMRTICEKVKEGLFDVSIYDQLADSVDGWAKENTFEPAWLAAYHPTQANPVPVLAYLQALTNNELKALPLHRRAATVDMAMTATELFLAQANQNEALWLIKTLKENFPEYIGREEEDPSSAAATEASLTDWAHVRLLEQLAPG